MASREDIRIKHTFICLFQDSLLPSSSLISIPLLHRHYYFAALPLVNNISSGLTDSPDVHHGLELHRGSFRHLASHPCHNGRWGRSSLRPWKPWPVRKQGKTPYLSRSAANLHV